MSVKKGIPQKPMGSNTPSRVETVHAVAWKLGSDREHGRARDLRDAANMERSDGRWDGG